MTANTYAALPPLAKSLVVGGQTLEILPLKVGEIPAFARAISPIAAKLGPEPDWLKLLGEDGDAVIEAVAIASRRDAQWVASLDMDEAIGLGEAVFEANADFFIRRVLPKITDMGVRMNQRIATATPAVTPGARPSPGS